MKKYQWLETAFSLCNILHICCSSLVTWQESVTFLINCINLVLFIIEICYVPSTMQPVGCIGCLIFYFQKTVNNCILASDLLLKYPLNKTIYHGVHSLTVKSIEKCSIVSWKFLSNCSRMDFGIRIGIPIYWWITVLVM